MHLKRPSLHKRLIVVLCIVCILPAVSIAQTNDALTASTLKEKLVQMGYTPRSLNDNPGKEKYVVDIKTAGFDVPIGYEVSPSTNFIWLTANLGTADTLNLVKNVDLLQQNAKIQPCFFYITTSGKLMMAVAIENRGVTPAILRRHTEKLAADVSSTSVIWK